MAYVIAEPCIGTKDNSCVEVCPVDCIHPTPDEPDYDKLMRGRLAILDEHRLGLPDIQAVIDGMAPLDGALGFLDWLRSRTQVLILSDTFETACSWTQFPALHARVTSAVQRALDEECGGGLVACRFTHVYPDGPAPYYTFVGALRPGAELAQWSAIKAAGASAVMGAAVLAVSAGAEGAFGVETLAARLLQVGGSIAVGVGVFWAAARLVGLEELDETIALLGRALGRR